MSDVKRQRAKSTLRRSKKMKKMSFFAVMMEPSLDIVVSSEKKDEMVVGKRLGSQTLSRKRLDLEVHLAEIGASDAVILRCGPKNVHRGHVVCSKRVFVRKILRKLLTLVLHATHSAPRGGSHARDGCAQQKLGAHFFLRIKIPSKVRTQLPQYPVE